ncbi:MAG: STM3941 family protein [Chloracidobacterium sp.]
MPTAPSLLTEPFPIILRPSRRRLTGLLAVSLLFVGLGIWLIPRNPLIGIANIIFFGACAIIFLAQCHPRASALVLDKEGFTFSSLFRAQTVRWEDVLAFEVVVIGPNRLVGWVGTTTPTQYRRLATINQDLFGVTACLSDNFGLPPEELAVLLTVCHQLALKPSAPAPDAPDASPHSAE